MWVNSADSPPRSSTMAERMHVAKRWIWWSIAIADMIALKAAGTIGDDGRRDREDSAGGRERKKKRKRKREAKSERGRNRGGEWQKERGEESKIKRKTRTTIRVDEPRTFALFTAFTHYRNTLLVPMVRSGSSGSVVHGGPRTEPAGDTRRRNILYDFSFHAWRSARRSTRQCYLPKPARTMIIGNAKL